MTTHKIKNSRLKQYSLLVCLMTMAASSHAAAVVSFSLNQSNRLADGIDYVSVNLTENSTGGVDVMASTLAPLNDLRNCHFGIQKMAFSFDDGTMANITGLPDGWTVKGDRGMNGFGKFDTGILGLASARTDTLSFTVNGVGIDDFESFFAVKVAGLDHTSGPASAFFGGSLEDGSFSGGDVIGGGNDGNLAPVPVPAAAWLFGSGLVGLIGITRRRKK